MFVTACPIPQWLTTAGSIVASVADLLLTVVLIIALRQSRTGFKRYRHKRHSNPVRLLTTDVAVRTR